MSNAIIVAIRVSHVDAVLEYLHPTDPHNKRPTYAALMAGGHEIKIDAHLAEKLGHVLEVANSSDENFFSRDG